ncbi:T-complex 11 [Cynara cardunculus var. scolymus]|uniref:T-complex 11 n=1 Tax=Cynara cardunculus var. scolymus TaxID=59895 RepID=A0A103XD78_CYNCS|nr:T-complex 11 [Cynara cardunculus var. scolymus]
MEVGVGNSPETGGVAMEFPVFDGAELSSPPTVPPRLRRRLTETKSSGSPSSVEEIEAKLRNADLRRQKFYESLSSKARPKRRSPQYANGHNLGQRLEAKLQAAEQKRINRIEENIGKVQSEIRSLKKDMQNVKHQLNRRGKSGSEEFFEGHSGYFRGKNDSIRRVIPRLVRQRSSRTTSATTTSTTVGSCQCNAVALEFLFLSTLTTSNTRGCEEEDGGLNEEAGAGSIDVE